MNDNQGYIHSDIHIIQTFVLQIEVYKNISSMGTIGQYIFVKEFLVWFKATHHYHSYTCTYVHNSNQQHLCRTEW